MEFMASCRNWGEKRRQKSSSKSPEQLLSRRWAWWSCGWCRAWALGNETGKKHGRVVSPLVFWRWFTCWRWENALCFVVCWRKREHNPATEGSAMWGRIPNFVRKQHAENRIFKIKHDRTMHYQSFRAEFPLDQPSDHWLLYPAFGVCPD